MSNNHVFAIAFKYHTLGHSVIPSGGGRDDKSALMTTRYLKTLSVDESLRIQQGVEYQW